MTLKQPWPWYDIRFRSLREFPPCSLVIQQREVLPKLPENWQQAFWTQSQNQIRQFSPQHFSNTLYAACVLELKIPETAKPLVQSTVTGNTEADIRNLQAMYSAKDYLEAQGINLVFNEDTPEKIRQIESTSVSRLEKKTGLAQQRNVQTMSRACCNTYGNWINSCYRVRAIAKTA